jgi:hypothetical protein
LRQPGNHVSHSLFGVASDARQQRRKGSADSAKGRHGQPPSVRLRLRRAGFVSLYINFLRGKPGFQRIDGNIIPDKFLVVFRDEFIFFQKAGRKKGQGFFQAAVGF